MFICEKCLKNYKTERHSIFYVNSRGNCEICGKRKKTWDVPSKELTLKDKRGMDGDGI